MFRYPTIRELYQPRWDGSKDDDTLCQVGVTLSDAYLIAMRPQWSLLVEVESRCTHGRFEQGYTQAGSHSQEEWEYGIQGALLHNEVFPRTLEWDHVQHTQAWSNHHCQQHELQVDWLCIYIYHINTFFLYPMKRNDTDMVAVRIMTDCLGPSLFITLSPFAMPTHITTHTSPYIDTSLYSWLGRWTTWVLALRRWGAHTGSWRSGTTGGWATRRRCRGSMLCQFILNIN